MGTKGDKLTKNAHLSAETLVDKLSAIAGIRSKKMFGGYGIFREEKMFRDSRFRRNSLFQGGGPKPSTLPGSPKARQNALF